MATITPALSRATNVQIVTWTGITTTTDTATGFQPGGKGAVHGACVGFSGTFAGGTTAVLQGSIDGTTYFTLTDLAGQAVSATAAKMQEFKSSAVYFKPLVTAGSADDVTVTVAFRN